jgi:hypothetical protein
MKMPEIAEIGTIAKLFERFKKVVKALDPFLDLGVILHLLKRDAQGKYELDPVAIRRHAPKFSKRVEHENRWTHLCSRLQSGERNAILLHFMPKLNEHQQADLVQSAADASEACQGRTEKENGELVLTELKHIAAIPLDPNQPDRQQKLRVYYVDSLNWMKRDPEDYWIVKLEKLAKRQFKNLQILFDWLKDTGPDGFLAFLQLIDNQIASAAPTVNHATEIINNATQRINNQNRFVKRFIR